MIFFNNYSKSVRISSILLLLKFSAIQISIPVFTGWINVDANSNDYFEVKQVVYVDDKIYDGLTDTQRIDAAIADVGVSVQLEKVEALDQIMQFGVPMTPALVINGEVKSAGKIPDISEIAKWIVEAQSAV